MADRTIVIAVDDDRQVSIVTAEMLQAAGYKAYCVTSGADCLIVLNAGVAVDAVVSDLHMPGMDGRMLRDVLRLDYPLVRFLMMSGDITNVERLKLHPTPVLDKPFTLRRLLDALDLTMARAA